MSDPALAYAMGDTDLGTIVVATGARGVAAILLADDAAAAARALRQALPGRHLIEDEGRAGAALAAAQRLVQAPGTGFDLPLALEGTGQEQAVWAALRAIPQGETRSYGAIAKALPVSATAQEVGAACAANRLALAVPCHRVVKADGGISGYRWGVARKRRLLAREQAA